MILIWRQFWGTQSIQHPGVHDAPCSTCGRPTITWPLERTGYVFRLPLFPRRFRATRACGDCARVDLDRLAPHLRPRRAMRWWTHAAWGLIACAVASVFLGARAAERETTALVEAPKVGDIWTVRPSRLPRFDGDWLEFGRVRVTRVGDRELRLSACTLTADDDDALHCRSYPIEMEPLARASVPRLLETGAIVTAWRAGQPAQPFLIALVIALGLLACLAVAVYYKSEHGSFLRSDGTPRARVV